MHVITTFGRNDTIQTESNDCQFSSNWTLNDCQQHVGSSRRNAEQNNAQNFIEWWSNSHVPMRGSVDKQNLVQTKTFIPVFFRTYKKVIFIVPTEKTHQLIFSLTRAIATIWVIFVVICNDHRWVCGKAREIPLVADLIWFGQFGLPNMHV